LNIKNIFRFLAVAQLGSLYLPVLFSHITKPISLHLFWSIGWIISLAIYNPSFWFKKTFLSLYFYALAIFILVNTVWIKLDIFSIDYLLTELISILTAISMLTYFISVKDYKGLSIVIKFAIICSVITVITSIIGLATYPMAARELAGVLARDNMEELIIYYKKIGIGGYGFFASLIFLIPVFIAEIKLRSNSNSYRLFFIILLILFFYGLIEAKYIANILIASIAILISGFGFENLNKSIFGLLIGIIIFFAIPLDIYSEILLYFSHMLSGSFLNERIKDLSFFLSFSSHNTEIGLRADRVPMLLEAFSNSPIWGGTDGNGHLHWLNKLAQFGLVGTLPLIYILFLQFRINLNKMHSYYRFYFFVSICSFFILGLIKSLIGVQIYFMIIFIIPGYFLMQSLLNHEIRKL